MIGLLLIIAAAVLLIVPGLFTAQVTLGWVLLGLGAVLLAIQLIAQVFVLRKMKKAQKDFGRSFRSGF